MSSTPFNLPGLPPSAPTALVIEPVLPHLLFVLSALSSIGFDITVAETFGDAKSSLATDHPDLLLTDVRLREYNGLHLVLRGRASGRHLPAIVLSQVCDAVLRQEAERLGATFIDLPTTRDDLVAAVYRTVFRGKSEVTILDPIRAPFERRRAERRETRPINASDPNRRVVHRRRDAATVLCQLSSR